MKKILIALETGKNEQACFRRIAEAAGVPCEFVFTTPARPPRIRLPRLPLSSAMFRRA